MKVIRVAVLDGSSGGCEFRGFNEVMCVLWRGSWCF